MEMSNNENTMSCAPADPRRSQVSGPASEKLDTEDSTGVGNQAPVLVNTTGSNKKYSQQVFHPGLFMRARSASLGTISGHNLTAKEKLNMETDSSLSADSDPTGPPPWQRVPVSRSAKRKKISDSPSPETVKTSNKFSGLQIDLTEEDPQIKPKRPSKPPPIILYGVDDVNKLTDLLETVAEKQDFTYKIINRNQLRITSAEMEAYKRIIMLVREKGLIGHTFNRKDERYYRLVIRNLHPSTPIDIIKDEIEATGNIVQGEIINAKFGPDKKATSTFFVNLAPGPKNKAAKEIKYIYHQSVVIEDPKKQKSIVQCHRCQQYGHSKNYCMRPYRCVKCGQSHKTSDCDKKDRNTPALCVLCNGPHPANYKGCEVYKEILFRKTKPSILKGRNYPIQPSKDIKNNEIECINNPEVHTNKTYATVTRTDNTEQTASKNLYINKIQDKDKKQYKVPTRERDRPQDSASYQDPQQLSYSSVEYMLLKQAEKFDLILQQMSTLMMLINKLVDKISK